MRVDHRTIRATDYAIDIATGADCVRVIASGPGLAIEHRFNLHYDMKDADYVACVRILDIGYRKGYQDAVSRMGG
jgi:hypothetical protein